MARITERDLVALEAGVEPWREVTTSCCDTAYRLDAIVTCPECSHTLPPDREVQVFVCPKCLRDTPTTSPYRRLVAEYRRLRGLVMLSHRYLDATQAPAALQDELAAEVAAFNDAPRSRAVAKHEP